MQVWHHTDLDGFSSGAVVVHHSRDLSIKAFALDYNDTFPIDTVKKDEIIYVVDLTLQPASRWKELLKRTKNAIWIDHHQTAMDEPGPQRDLQGLRSTEHSAARLAWNFFNSGDDVPEAIRLISLFDTWQHEEHKDGPRALQFMYGMKAQDFMDAKWKGWEKLFEADAQTVAHGEGLVEQIVSAGKDIKMAFDNENQESIGRLSYRTEFEGHSCLACNHSGHGSLLFEGLPEADEVDILSVYVFNGKLWTISLYSRDTKKVDVSVLAKKHGGGGHPGAAGFSANEVPFKPI